MDNGEWRMENGEWRMDNGEWTMDNAPISSLRGTKQSNPYKKLSRLVPSFFGTPRNDGCGKIIHSPLSIIHYPLSIIHYPLFLSIFLFQKIDSR